MPGLDWILQCIAHKAEVQVLESILEKYTQYSNNALVLDSIISSYSPEYVAAHAVNFADLISKADTSAYPQYQLYYTLGVNLVLSSPHKDVLVKILNHNWPIISKVSDPANYMKCAETYIEIPAKHMTVFSTSSSFLLLLFFFFLAIDRVLLGSRGEHHPWRHCSAYLAGACLRKPPPPAPVRSGKDFDPHDRLHRDLRHGKTEAGVSAFLYLHLKLSPFFPFQSNFTPLLDMFQSNPTTKVEVCKTIMSYFSRTPDEPTQDLILINGLLYVAKTLHDSVSALTFDDEKRQISELILSFIKRVSYPLPPWFRLDPYL